MNRQQANPEFDLPAWRALFSRLACELFFFAATDAARKRAG
jgi:hypothetical protein